MDALIPQLLNYGTAPTLLALAVVVGILIKKVDENGRKDEERAAQLRASISAQMDVMEKRFEDRFSSGDRRLDELSNRVSCVERDYLPREEHYKEFSGWRSEINRLSDLIINLFKEQKK